MTIVYTGLDCYEFWGVELRLLLLLKVPCLDTVHQVKICLYKVCSYDHFTDPSMHVHSVGKY